MGFERNYQIKIPSNQLNIKNFSLNFHGILYCLVILLFPLSDFLLSEYTLLSDYILLSDFSLFINTDNISNSWIVPIMIYHNAKVDKSQILKDNKGKAGIYMWVNMVSHKIYIGSAINLSKRFYRYFSVLALKTDNTYICRALLRYSHSVFCLQIIEQIDITGLSLEEAQIKILSREQYYLNIIFSNNKDNIYNINPIAGSSLGYKHTPETLAKISGSNHPMYGKSLSVETKAFISKIMSGENNPMFGKIHSDETKALMSKAHKGKTFSEETRILMSEAHKGKIISEKTRALISKVKTGGTHSAETKTKISLARNKIIFVYSFDEASKESLLYKSFDSCSDAAKFFNCSIRVISYYLDKNKLYKKQWIFSSIKK